jgi:hypothetical protein
MLKYLSVSGCTRLKYLPSRVVNLTSLQVLDTTACLRLKWADHTPSAVARAESFIKKIFSYKQSHVDPTIGASLEDICTLVTLTNLAITVQANPVVMLHNICALTELKFLRLGMCARILQDELPHWFIHLERLEIGSIYLEYLSRSFTCRGAFPALINCRLFHCSSLAEFPEVDEGALPKLRTLEFDWCRSLETLPLSLEVLTSLRRLILSFVDERLIDSCRRNCEKSTLWSKLDIQCDQRFRDYMARKSCADK